MQGIEFVDKFHAMEIKYGFFDYPGKEPYWDIVRYTVFCKQYMDADARVQIESQKITHHWKEWLLLTKCIFTLLWRVFFCRYKHLILTNSRNKFFEKEDYWYDSIAYPIIQNYQSVLCMDMYFVRETPYAKVLDFSNVIIRTMRGNYMPQELFDKISRAVNDTFGENRITYDDLNVEVKRYLGQLKFYKMVLKYLQPNNVIVSRGNPKAIVKACKERDIPCILLQHESIEKDEINWSYPHGITQKSNILFPYYTAMFGTYWGKNVNAPVGEYIYIGNDDKYKKLDVPCDNSFCVISSIIHGVLLKSIAKDLALARPDLSFVFKLHPNEFDFKGEYISFFEGNSNVRVVSTEEPTSVVIARSRCVIAIVSGCVYEALHAGKRVGIYKRLNYERQLALLPNDNLFFFDNVDGFLSQYDKPVTELKESYYIPFNKENCDYLMNLK